MGIGRLVRWSANKKMTYVRTLSLDLSSEAIARIGQVQGLIGAEVDDKVGDALVAHLEDALENGIESALNKLPASADQETVFEAAVAKVNHALSRLLSDRGLVVPADGVNGVLLSQRGRNVAAAVWGRPSILLVRRKTTDNVRIFNVLSNDDDARQRTGTRRGFTNLVSGSLSSRDLMVVANKDITSLLEMDALADILSGGTPDVITAQLTDALSSRHDDLSLALLLLEGVTDRSPIATDRLRDPRAARLKPPSGPGRAKTETAVVAPKPDRPFRSMASNAAKTATGLAAGIGTAVARYADIMRGAMRHRKEVVNTAVPQGPLAGPRVPTDAPSAVDVPGPVPSAASAATEKTVEGPVSTDAPRPKTDLKETVSAAGDAAAQAAANVIADLSTKEGRERIRRLSRERTDKFFERLVDWYNELPKTRRMLLIVALSLILFLNVSVGVAGIQRLRARAAADYERQIASITQQVDSADASLIYGDEDRARQLLDDATKAIAALPAKNAAQKAKKNELNGLIAQKTAKLRHDVQLPTPQVAASIATSSGSPNLIKLAQFDGVLWTTDAKGNVYRVQNGQAQKVGDGPANTDVFVPARDSVLTGNAGGLTKLGTDGVPTGLKLDNGGTPVAISDASTYGSRLYILDASHNRILRYPAVRGGYASPQMYIKDGTDLSSAVSFAIDGYIYVLSKNGTVTRLLRGDDTPYAVSKVDPTVTDALRIRTSTDDKDLYVLAGGDPARIIKFDKATGKLLDQYESDQLAGAKDFVVNEASSSLMVLKGNEILQFTWPPDKQ